MCFLEHPASQLMPLRIYPLKPLLILWSLVASDGLVNCVTQHPSLIILTLSFSICNVFKPVITIFYGCYTSRNRRKPIPLSLIPTFSTICILSLSPLVSQPPQASRQHLLNSNPFPYQILPFLQSLFFEAPLKRSTIP